MNLDHFTRFFVRFNGLLLILWAIYDFFSLPQVYANYALVKGEFMGDSFLAGDFYALVGRLALQLLAAGLLLTRTDKVITFVLTGQWRTPSPDAQSEEKVS